MAGINLAAKAAGRSSLSQAANLTIVVVVAVVALVALAVAAATWCARCSPPARAPTKMQKIARPSRKARPRI